MSPFLYLSNFEKDKTFEKLPEELTLEEFTQYLTENALDLDIDKLKNFNNALRFDVKACAKKRGFFNQG